MRNLLMAKPWKTNCFKFSVLFNYFSAGIYSPSKLAGI